VADGDYRRVEDKSLGDLVTQVSEQASTLIREEIELAKTEIEVKAKRLAQGAAVGAAAGFFLFFVLVFVLEALAWGLSDAFFPNDIWAGFLVTSGILLVLAGLAGFIAYRAFQAGSPPTPQQAIEEAKLIRETLEHPETVAASARTTPQP
jgi:uncharacterized membrane protein YqjE